MHTDTVDRCCSPSDNKPTRTDGKHNECAEKIKVIKIRDGAFIAYVCSRPYRRTAEDSGGFSLYIFASVTPSFCALWVGGER